VAQTGEEVLTEGKLRICFAVLFDLTDWALNRTGLSFDLTRLADLIGLLELLGASSSLSPTLHKTMTGQLRGGRACHREKKMSKGESLCGTLAISNAFQARRSGRYCRLSVQATFQ
jgi:hypothetical protein